VTNIYLVYRLLLKVRFGSKADTFAPSAEFRFLPCSGRLC
jgi:hypothetical protein